MREAGHGDDVCRAQFKPRHKNVIEYNTCGCYTLFSLQIFLETVVIEFCGSGSRAAGLSLSGGFEGGRAARYSPVTSNRVSHSTRPYQSTDSGTCSFL